MFCCNEGLDIYIENKWLVTRNAITYYVNRMLRIMTSLTQKVCTPKFRYNS